MDMAVIPPRAMSTTPCSSLIPGPTGYPKTPCRSNEFSAVIFDTQNLKVGDTVVSSGSPEGCDRHHSWSVRRVRASAKHTLHAIFWALRENRFGSFGTLGNTKVGNQTYPCHRIPNVIERIPHGSEGMVL